eukprot:1929807-Heterocapsa_arctica.AAC.1
MTDHRDGEVGWTTLGDTRRKTSKSGLEMKDIMKLAEETWGGLWVDDAEDLPKLNKQHMPLITEDE